MKKLLLFLLLSGCVQCRIPLTCEHPAYPDAPTYDTELLDIAMCQ